MTHDQASKSEYSIMPEHLLRIDPAGDLVRTTADVSFQSPGPAPPPIRGFPNFPHASSTNRNLALGSGRLQNTNKLGPSVFCTRIAAALSSKLRCHASN